MDVRERLAWFRIAHAGTHDGIGRVCERFAGLVTRWAGTTPAFIVAVSLIAVWLVAGPWCRWSDTWQLVANTFTTLVNFVMAFVLQRSMNKESAAMQLKQNELLASQPGASNRLLAVENLPEAEIKALSERYRRLAAIVRREQDPLTTHTVEEVEPPREDKR